MIRRLLLLSLIAMLYLFGADTSVLAVEVKIIEWQSTISQDPFEVGVSISGAGEGTNYLRVELYREGEKNYFGETYNGQEWYGGSDHTKYQRIQMGGSGTWEGKVKAQIGSPNSTEYPGPGEYLLRVRRYTQSGSYSAQQADASAVKVSITAQAQASPTSPAQTPGVSQSNNADPTPTTNAQQAPQSYSNIYISEAMVYPARDEPEWVELYNGNSFDVNLVGWYLDDVQDSGSSPKIFTIAIAAGGYGVVELSSSVFNNTGDAVRLLDVSSVEKDSFSYDKGEQGKTFGRTSLPGGAICQQEATKGGMNGSCIDTSTPMQTKVPTATPSSTNLASGDEEEGEDAISTGSAHPQDTLLSYSQFVTNGGEFVSGDVLGETTTVKRTPSTSASYRRGLAVVKGFTASASLISLLNIFYILHRMVNRSKIKNQK